MHRPSQKLAPTTRPTAKTKSEPQHGDIKRHLVEKFDADRQKWTLTTFIPEEVSHV